MVCNRCIEAVTGLFRETGHRAKTVRLGEVEVDSDLSSDELANIGEMLRDRGFDLLEDKNSRIIERVKNLLIAIIHRDSGPVKINYSVYLEEITAF